MRAFILIVLLGVALAGCGKAQEPPLSPGARVLKDNPSCPLAVVCADGKAYCAGFGQNVCN